MSFGDSLSSRRLIRVGQSMLAEERFRLLSQCRPVHRCKGGRTEVLDLVLKSSKTVFSLLRTMFFEVIETVFWKNGDCLLVHAESVLNCHEMFIRWKGRVR